MLKIIIYKIILKINFYSLEDSLKYTLEKGTFHSMLIVRQKLIEKNYSINRCILHHNGANEEHHHFAF